MARSSVALTKRKNIRLPVSRKLDKGAFLETFLDRVAAEGVYDQLDVSIYGR